MKSRRIAWVVAMTMAVCIAGGAWLLAQGPQPTIGPLTVSPPNIVFNTATPTLFVVRINTPTVNPSAVSLQQVDATGLVLSTVGAMNDKGKTGDAVADDRNFTIRATLNHPQVGKVYYRVVAAFRGTTPSAYSSVVPMDVDPFTLPPDPGEAGKQTLQGIDLDNDGVRDDVQRWIGLNYPEAQTVRRQLMLIAESQQDLLGESQSAVLTDAMERISQDMGDSLHCLAVQLSGTGQSLSQALLATDRMLVSLEEQLTNTQVRRSTFDRANQLFSGSTRRRMTDPATWAARCR